MSASALEGIRIIDCSMWFAGPLTTLLLAEMGAEVIKVESIQAMDGWRGALANPVSPRVWETAPTYNSVNHSKYGLTLDLTRPQGVDVFKRLVTVGDVVVENYTPRVMANFGLDYEVLCGINPALIMVSMPGYGGTGPWKDYVAFAFLMEELSGMPQLTGYPDGPPMLMGASQADAIGGYHGAFAVLTALEYRRRTGRGQYIDLSQLEAMTCLMAEPILDYGMNGRIWPRRGNRHPATAPHGCYRCKGEDKWVTIAVADDAQWGRFCSVTGNDQWRQDARFADALSRWKNQDELDALIGTWTAGLDPYEIMHLLQGAGIAAGPVLLPAEIYADPHLQAREFFVTMDREEVGTHSYPGVYAKFSRTPGQIRRPSPTLGEHNEYVLGKLLGMPEEEIAALAAENIIGKGPLLEQSKRSI